MSIGNRIIASITGQGDACFIATVAYGSPLASDLNVFRAFRDRVLQRFSFGQRFVDSYYQGWGPKAASWIGGRSTARFSARVFLTGISVPLKVILFGRVVFFIIIFLTLLCALVVIKKLGWTWRRTIISTSALAFLMIIGYSLLVEVPVAQASYSPIATYYYTLDHIGRPMNLRDGDGLLRWYEQHYAFGDLINGNTLNGPMSAGAGDHAITWQPSFRFPGQYQDPESFPFTQNHYREYMPGLGRYNRGDSLLKSFPSMSRFSEYNYGHNNTIIYIDILGLRYIKIGDCQFNKDYLKELVNKITGARCTSESYKYHMTWDLEMDIGDCPDSCISKKGIAFRDFSGIDTTGGGTITGLNSDTVITCASSSICEGEIPLFNFYPCCRGCKWGNIRKTNEDYWSTSGSDCGQNALH